MTAQASAAPLANTYQHCVPPPSVALHHWVERHPFALTIPDHLLIPAARENDARRFKVSGLGAAIVMQGIRDEIDADLKRYARRREVESEIADYLERIGHYSMSASLRKCRVAGNAGWRENAAGEACKVIAWDFKCGQTRLCPDEAREEQMRLVERYAPAILAWQRGRRGRQIQYCVLTWPNLPPGELGDAKRAMFKQAAAWLKRLPCRSIKGALASQEDPLSASDDWNLHINLILLVDGRFDWKAARADWFKRTRGRFSKSHKDFQVHFENIKEGGLTKSIMELVKYGVKHVTEGKNDGRDKGVTAKASETVSAQDGGTSRSHADEKMRQDGLSCIQLQPEVGSGDDHIAPGLTDWPAGRFFEWWASGLNFRRTRSYGALFRVEDIPPPSLSNVHWIGRITYDGGQYVVRIQGVGSIDLIQGHKSGFEGEEKKQNSQIQSRAGPPYPASVSH